MRKVVGDNALAGIDRVVKFSRPKHGVAFTMPVGALIRSGVSQSTSLTSKTEANRACTGQYLSLWTKVGRNGHGCGPRGWSPQGTIINARGSGIHETSLFSEHGN